MLQGNTRTSALLTYPELVCTKAHSLAASDVSATSSVDTAVSYTSLGASQQRLPSLLAVSSADEDASRLDSTSFSGVAAPSGGSFASGKQYKDFLHAGQSVFAGRQSSCLSDACSKHVVIEVLVELLAVQRQ
jgi:hypothetical protein